MADLLIIASVLVGISTKIQAIDDNQFVLGENALVYIENCITHIEKTGGLGGSAMPCAATEQRCKFKTTCKLTTVSKDNTLVAIYVRDMSQSLEKPKTDSKSPAVQVALQGRAPVSKQLQVAPEVTASRVKLFADSKIAARAKELSTQNLVADTTNTPEHYTTQLKTAVDYLLNSLCQESGKSILESLLKNVRDNAVDWTTLKNALVNVLDTLDKKNPFPA